MSASLDVISSTSCHTCSIDTLTYSEYHVRARVRGTRDREETRMYIVVFLYYYLGMVFCTIFTLLFQLFVCQFLLYYVFLF
jgi:hypothetical protein